MSNQNDSLLLMKPCLNEIFKPQINTMSLYSNFQQFYVKNYYQLIPAFIIIVACLGSLVTYYLTLKGMSPLNFFQLFLCTVGTMTYMASVLVQLPRKTSFLFFVIGLLIEVLLLSLNLIF